MKRLKYPSLHGQCYYCVCTVCNSINCPFSNHYPYTHCDRCHVGKGKRPRLDCDFFHHYKHGHQYRIYKVKYPLKTLYNVHFAVVGWFYDVPMEFIERLSRSYICLEIKPSKVVQDNSKLFLPYKK